MCKIAKWLTSVTFILTQLQENCPQVDAASCEMKTTRSGKSHAICAKKNLLEVPDLDEDVVVLDLSYNDNLALKKNSIANYKEITDIYMTNIEHPKEVSPDFFSSSGKLEVLDVSYSCLGIPFPKLPASLVHLRANFIGQHCHLGENSIKALPELKPLVNLKNLSLEGNNFMECPDLSAQWLLTSLNLRRNPLKFMNYTHLAPLCSLEALYVDLSELPNDDIEIEQRCCRIRQWTTERNILIDIKCWTEPCLNETLEESSLKKYSDCLKSLETKIPIPSRKSFFYIIIILIILLAILYFAYPHIRKFASSKMQENRGSQSFFPANEEETEPEVGENEETTE